MLRAVTLMAMRDELQKIAATSSPAIVSPPSPGGDGKQLSSMPSAPTPPGAVVGKALSKTNLQKTNYTRVNTQVTAPNPAQTAEFKGLTPPAVRS